MKLLSPLGHALFRLLLCAAGPLDGGGGGGQKKNVVTNPYDKNNNNNAAAAAAAAASNNDGDDNNIIIINNNKNNGGQRDAPRSAALQSNVARALSTLGGDTAAIDLLNYYLVHVLNVDDINTIDLSLIGDDIESFLTGYSYYLRNTNIPHNHKRYIERPDLEPTSYLMHTSLTGYLSKAIQLMKELFPDDEFLGDAKAMENISGAKFEKACKRAQSKKDYRLQWLLLWKEREMKVVMRGEKMHLCDKRWLHYRDKWASSCPCIILNSSPLLHNGHHWITLHLLLLKAVERGLLLLLSRVRQPQPANELHQLMIMKKQQHLWIQRIHLWLHPYHLLLHHLRKILP